ncbi:cell wall-binding repeat-containing protein, partial [Dehalobacter sp. UNSWDHB]|uniref:cell wall-binding repeat-containing protein n=2 Tax=Dehalobacter TaxID=56112 RepID=UPI001FA78A53
RIENMRKKLFVVIPIIICLLLSSYGTVFATETPATTRLAGNDRYETAAQIAKAGWQQADCAVLAYGGNYPDALAAVPLAYKLNAPILLTNKDTLNANTSNVLQALKIKTVYLIGGTGVISANQETQLKNARYTVKRIAGQDRYDTAIKIAAELGAVHEIAVTTGSDYADALSIGPIAALKQMPIILVSKDQITNGVQSYLSSQSITTTYIIGDQSIISDTVANKFSNPERITGKEKYERNVAILDEFWSTFDQSKVCFATGENFADALAGGVYAAKKGGTVMLIKNDLPVNTCDYLNHMTSLNSYTVFGGEGAIPSSLLLYISSHTRTPSTTLDFGTLSGQNYTNNYFNLSITIPDGWQTEDNIALTQEGTDSTSTDASTYDLAYLLSASKGDSTGFIAQSSDIGTLVSSKNFLELYKVALTEFVFPREVYTQNLNGTNFNVLEFQATDNSGIAYGKIYAAVVKGQICLFTIAYSDSAGLAEVNQIFSSINFGQ